MGGGGRSGAFPIHSVKPKLVMRLCGSSNRFQRRHYWSTFLIRQGFNSDKYLAEGEKSTEEIPSVIFFTSFFKCCPPLSSFESRKSPPLKNPQKSGSPSQTYCNLPPRWTHHQHHQIPLNACNSQYYHPADGRQVSLVCVVICDFCTASPCFPLLLHCTKILVCLVPVRNPYCSYLKKREIFSQREGNSDSYCQSEAWR